MTRRERLEQKLAKREEWAVSRAAKADAAQARVHQIADGIPFGQPILVGHHSERRHRADIGRIQSGMSATVEHAKMADRHAAAAAGIERALATSVFSDDADAVERLTEIVADLEAKRDRIKAFNASCRKGSPDESLLSDGERANLASVRRTSAYALGKRGEYPAYELSNLGATIRQKKQRIEQIGREREQAAAGIRAGGRAMTSRYPGVCGDCGGEIGRGDAIVWYRTTREATHASCPGREES